MAAKSKDLGKRMKEHLKMRESEDDEVRKEKKKKKKRKREGKGKEARRIIKRLFGI